MADISKCNGTHDLGECDIKNKCYRFTALASEYQSYLTGSDNGEGCEWFYPTVKREVHLLMTKSGFDRLEEVLKIKKELS